MWSISDCMTFLSDEIDETEDDYFVVNETEHIGNKC